ncbi:prolipoprotein diacylglyceryl transferase [Neolewinella xylanilytica]|uniref:Phosphatidylglycerol--prolipoprotein diacylglyceryl transferase n=1 Tax=Neolewinella xylanilytica TaxID=1514080 RepID=A0A2S6I0U5_9BACT|nr:prolipoprotein diacylglyceryl transferase [Neolewinella xylanilytica]PPK84566.1 prolipoprotein diacylglyceryl transferase [Neolewinella xylanilytica]
MYPDLSYLLYDLIGTARDNGFSIVKTFGLFLLLAFIVAAKLVKMELQRRERIGQLRGESTLRVPGHTVTAADYVTNTILGFLLGYKIPYAIANFEAWQLDPSGTLLSTDGYFLTGLLGAALFFGYYYQIGRKQGELPEPQPVVVYPSDRVGPITMMAALGGLLGAKFFAVIEYWDRFLQNPIQELFSGGGLAIYGGLIGGGVAVFLYLRKHKIPVLPVMDAVAPALIVAYGVGRIGCQLSGDGDWGTAITAIPDGWFLPDWLYGFDYPNNVLNRGVPIPGCADQYCSVLPELHYPTPIYETLMAFAIGGILWAVRKPLTVFPAMLFCIYLFFNGVERFFIEYVRLNDQYDFLGFSLTQAQIIALGFMLAGIVGGIWVYRRGRVVYNRGAPGAQEPR